MESIPAHMQHHTVYIRKMSDVYDLFIPIIFGCRKKGRRLRHFPAPLNDERGLRVHSRSLNEEQTNAEKMKSK